jgi:hypothetical protein
VEEFVVTSRLEGYKTSDNFNLTNGSELQQPTTGSKYFWRPWLGPAWVSMNNHARPTSTSYTYTWVDTSSEQATVEAKVITPGAGAWVIFRFNEINDSYYRFGQSAGSYSVQLMSGSVQQTMPVAVQTLASPAPQAGDIIRVRHLPGGTVECSVNGTLTHRFVDNVTNIRWTLNGLAAAGSQTAFDDLTIVPFSR